MPAAVVVGSAALLVGSAALVVGSAPVVDSPEALGTTTVGTDTYGADTSGAETTPVAPEEFVGDAENAAEDTGDGDPTDEETGSAGDPAGLEELTVAAKLLPAGVVTPTLHADSATTARPRERRH